MAGGDDLMVHELANTLDRIADHLHAVRRLLIIQTITLLFILGAVAWS